jgi:16S rRNA (cytidine1402-2'-O)-methyltransferase
MTAGRRGGDRVPERLRGDGPAALVLVATPIGNLDDLSPRAVGELRRADVVACEDTRRTGRLFELAGIERCPFLVVNDHTEAGAVREILSRIDRGERVAVVTDAGMPGISDPGERLVRAAAAAGHTIEVVPGPSAALGALVVSGLPTGRFVFEGFLPRRGSGRRERLAELATERRTIVIYEAPHRLARTLEDLLGVIDGARRVALVRELTKLHEEMWRGTLRGALDRVGEVEPRGEYVILIEGGPAPVPADDAAIAAALGAARDRGLTTRDAVITVAGELSVPRRRVYRLATGTG